MIIKKASGSDEFCLPKKAHWIMQRWPNVASSSGHFVLQGIPPAGESYSFHGGGLGAGGDRSSSVASTGSVRPPLPLPTMFSVRFAYTTIAFLNKEIVINEDSNHTWNSKVPT